MCVTSSLKTNRFSWQWANIFHGALARTVQGYGCPLSRGQTSKSTPPTLLPLLDINTLHWLGGILSSPLSYISSIEVVKVEEPPGRDGVGMGDLSLIHWTRSRRRIFVWLQFRVCDSKLKDVCMLAICDARLYCVFYYCTNFLNVMYY